MIETCHFSCWGIIAWIKEAINKGYELLPVSGASVNQDEDEDEETEPQGSLRIKVICFCRVETSHIKVTLVILKELNEHTEVVKQKYQQEGWRLITEIGNLKFAEASTKKIYISMDPTWSKVGNDGWEIRPETNPKVGCNFL